MLQTRTRDRDTGPRSASPQEIQSAPPRTRLAGWRSSMNMNECQCRSCIRRVLFHADIELQRITQCSTVQDEFGSHRVGGVGEAECALHRQDAALQYFSPQHSATWPKDSGHEVELVLACVEGGVVTHHSDDTRRHPIHPRLRIGWRDRRCGFVIARCLHDQNV
jgi:hypothetical protein